MLQGETRIACNQTVSPAGSPPKAYVTHASQGSARLFQAQDAAGRLHESDVQQRCHAVAVPFTSSVLRLRPARGPLTCTRGCVLCFTSRCAACTAEAEFNAG